MKFEGYLLERGSVVVLASIFIVLALVSQRTGLPIEFGNAFLTVLLVVLFYLLTVAGLSEFGFIEKIPERHRNSKTLIVMMILLGFFCIELYNVFVVWTQGGTYFNPLFAWNFVVDKVVNLLVVSASVGVVVFFDFPKNLE